MPGLTAGGLPYPLGTEAVRDGDNAIKALADALEIRGSGLLIQHALGNVTTQPTGLARVDFAKAFKVPPTVLVTPGSIGMFDVRVALGDYSNAYNPTAANFHILARNASNNSAAASVAVLFYWVAIGPAT